MRCWRLAKAAAVNAVCGKMPDLRLNLRERPAGAKAPFVSRRFSARLKAAP